MGERGRGHVYEQNGAFHWRFYETENRDGGLVLVRRSVKLHTKDREHNSAGCKAVRALRDSRIEELAARELAKTGTPDAPAKDQLVVDYWNKTFMPYCEAKLSTGPRSGQQRLKPSTLRGYRQIFHQFLSGAWAGVTLRQYKTAMGDRLLDSLTATQGFHVLKHIRAVASSCFKRAIKDQIITVNVWSTVAMPDNVQKGQTRAYDRTQAEDIISALVDHVDAQLVMALACFLALGPAEIAGLEWNDVDTASGWLHIRRNVVLGKVGTTKTIERATSLPLLDEVRVPLELWRDQCQHTGARIIPDLLNLIPQVIRPHVDGDRYKLKGVPQTCKRCKIVPAGSPVTWHGMYSARRGAISHAINVSGNLALGQRLARHASAQTTANFYHKTMGDKMFAEGMKRLTGKVE
jgi:integrase